MRRQISCKHLCAATASVIGFLLLNHFGIVDILLGKSFSQFSYPLDVDLVDIVRKAQQKIPIDVKPINEYFFSHIVESKRICHDVARNKLLVLTLIKSKIDHFENRMAIRETWGGLTEVNGHEIRRVFLLGIHPSSNKTLQKKVLAESNKYNDLIQDNFQDTYFNNTLKSMMGFKWSATYCRNAKFLFCVDDDYYVSPRNLVGYLLSLGEKNRFISGYVFRISLPQRNIYSKWYISRKEYPFMFFPEYPTAGSFVLTGDLAEVFDISVRYTKYLRFDDVFLGIVAYKLGLKPVNYKEFHLTKTNPLESRQMIASHGYNQPDELRQIWQKVKPLETNT